MKLVVLLLMLLIGAALYSQGSTTASSDLVFSNRPGEKEVLRHVADLPWQGARMKTGTLEVFCASGAVAIGRLHDYYFGLNGHTTQRAATARILLPSGTERHLLRTDRSELVRTRAVEADADPLEYNRPFSEGLRLSLATCGR